jgi:EmrB/QacA subfamily drug resistance transporter
VEGTTQPLGRGTWLALIAMGIAVFVIANDFSAINVAIPQIEHDFKTSVTTAQWVVNAYALTFGVLIVTGGRIADLFGRRRAFLIGTAIFAFFSVLGGTAQTEAWLIATRVAMGVGGALMWPAILGMTYAALPEERAGLAGGFILGAAGLGNAAGPLIGGALTDLLSWRWIFFLNLPVAAFAAFVTLREIKADSPKVEDTRMDYAGIVTVSVGLVSLLLAFDQVIDWGWGDPRIIALLALFVVLIGSFVAAERRAGDHALVPPDVMRNRDFAWTCGAILMMSAVFFAAMLYLPQLMINVLGYSAIGAGAGMLPMMATFASVSFIAGNLYERFGAKPLLILGSACIFYPTATTAGVTAVDESRRSLAGAILYMFQIAGGSVGLGLTTTVFIGASDRAQSGSGFIDGIQTAFALDAAIAVGGFLIASLFIGGRVKLPAALHRVHAGPSPRGHGP